MSRKSKRFPRYVAARLREALADTPAVLIHGPRQSGKTTLARTVGEPHGYGDVFGALGKVSRTLGRRVNPTVYSAEKVSKRTKDENAFITRVLEGAKVWVIGSQNDLAVAA